MHPVRLPRSSDVHGPGAQRPPSLTGPLANVIQHDLVTTLSLSYTSFILKHI